jgi:hypothetical protein
MGTERGDGQRQALTVTELDTCDSDLELYARELADTLARLERQIGDCEARLDVLESRQRR